MNCFPLKYLPSLLVFISLSLSGQTIETKKIHSTVLDQERKIWIYLPWQYDDYSDKSLEVIYVFDAQSRAYFDVIHSMTQFIGGEEFAFIVVGIESPFIEEKNQSRNRDFLPEPKSREAIEKYGEYSGGADHFLAFLKTEAIPFIDRNYRTLPTRVAVGHSTGGTLITYCLLKEPGLFDAYLAISPNLAYDRGQMVDRLKKFQPEDLAREKYVFISNANENKKTAARWSGWSESRESVIDILKNEKFDSKIKLETMDFSATENHGSTFPPAAFYGLKSYINYQFRTGHNITAYYDRLADQELITFNAEFVNMLAYECFWNNKPDDALTVIHWAIKKFPEAHNLYDSQGEFYETKGDIEKAEGSYEKAIKTLHESKGEMDATAFKEQMNYYQENYDRVKR